MCWMRRADGPGALSAGKLRSTASRLAAATEEKDRLEVRLKSRHEIVAAHQMVSHRDRIVRHDTRSLRSETYFDTYGRLGLHIWRKD